MRQKFNELINISVWCSVIKSQFHRIECFCGIENRLKKLKKLSKKLNWWKELNLLAIYIQTALLEYFTQRENVFIDRKLIWFKGQSCHTIVISDKKTRYFFKIYDLYQFNYSLFFSFVLKINVDQGLIIIFIQI